MKCNALVPARQKAARRERLIETRFFSPPKTARMDASPTNGGQALRLRLRRAEPEVHRRGPRLVPEQRALCEDAERGLARGVLWVRGGAEGLRACAGDGPGALVLK